MLMEMSYTDKNMKKLIFFLMLFLGAEVTAQNYWFTKTRTTSLDTASLMLLYQSGTDKTFSIGTLSALINDTTTQIRTELADTAAQLRSEIGGGGAWTSSGGLLFPTNYNTDITLIGSNTDSYAGTYKLVVTGKQYISEYLISPYAVFSDLAVTGSFTIGADLNWSTGPYINVSNDDSLKFYDNVNTDGVTLSDLVGATSQWTLSGTSLYPNSTTYNLGVGKTNPTYKLDVTGDVYATNYLYGNRLKLKQYDANTEWFTSSATRAGLKVNNTVVMYWQNDSITTLKDIIPSPTNTINLGTSVNKYYEVASTYLSSNALHGLADSIRINRDLVPSADSLTLGYADYPFSMIYGDTIKSIDFKASGNYGFPLNDDTYYGIYNTNGSLRMTSNGNTILDLLGDPSGDFVISFGDMSPMWDDSLNLGSESYFWNKLYANEVYTPDIITDNYVNIGQGAGIDFMKLDNDSIVVSKSIMPNGTIDLGSQYNYFDDVHANRFLAADGGIFANIDDPTTGLYIDAASQAIRLDCDGSTVWESDPTECEFTVPMQATKITCDSLYTTKSSVWADFVFKKDYRLPDFSDQVSYYKKHHSLPALTMPEKETTVNVTKRLESTIEELEKAYLYIEQLENRLTNIERKIETLNKRKR